MRLVLATHNRHKQKEIQAVLSDLDIEVLLPEDFPDCREVIEDGHTLEENAEKKARETCAMTGEWSLADDSGLEVEALDGAPGVYSARYAGEHCSFADNNAKLLRELDGVPPERRVAHFRCVLALAEPMSRGGVIHAGRLELFEGRIEGRILHSPRGDNGFGYDPVFYIPSEGCTLAELTSQRKNQVSHRAKALAAFRAALSRS